MKILINTSNLKKGGAIQVAHSFLTEIRENTEHVFHVVKSSVLSQQINIQEYPENFTFYNYSKKLSLLRAVGGKDAFLENIEKRLNPDCILTIFGPAYWTPKTLHIVGFADGWCYNPNSIAFKKLSFADRIKKNLRVSIKNYCIKKEADFIYLETFEAKKKVESTLKLDKTKVKVIGNTYHSIFNENNLETNKLEQIDIKSLNLITVSANYPHKNLEIIKLVIPVLLKKKLNVTFYLTLPEEIFKQVFSNYKKWVKNIGPVDIKFVPSLYKQCDAMFLPTLLETFSASYPEAMKMGKPILTSDLSFSRNICGTAAEYFNPLDPEDIALKIENIINNKKKRDFLVVEGYNQLTKFETAKSRAEKLLALCESVT